MRKVPRSNDDELTVPERATSFAWHFRCSVCELEAVTEPTTRAPECPNCDRYMAPVNTKRASA